MLRSLFTAINSLRYHQMYMDVVADNLANVNTPGFKGSAFTFKDQIAQMISSGSAPTTTLGGVNPTQVGLGTNVGSITRVFTQGALQSTGRDLDIAISGDGFFIYNNGTNQTFYSRDGGLTLDGQGYLVNASTGARIQGWMANAAGTVNTAGGLTGINIPIDASVARATQNAYLSGNLDSTSAIGSTYNVTIGVYDALGALHSVALQFTRAGANQWTMATTTIDGVANVQNAGSVTFDPATGQYDPASGSGTITVPGSTGTTNFNVTLDLAGLTQLAESSTAALNSQDGLAAGELVGFNISGNTGEIFGVYSNGAQRLMAQLAMADFNNPGGLTRVGENLYLPSLNSGVARVGVANTGGRGTVSSGTVEGSNVDMSREFTNMILAQRGFQASTRIITTSDEMLQELVNLKR